jgi:hypothetical protein
MLSPEKRSSKANLIQLSKKAFILRSQAGWRKALRLKLSEGELSYNSNSRYGAVNYPTQYPCVVVFDIVNVSEIVYELTIKVHALQEYALLLNSEIEDRNHQLIKIKESST